MSKIPTHAAFTKVAGIYRHVHAEPVWNPTLTKMLGPEVLAVIKCPLSPLEILAEFPIEQYEHEVQTIAYRISKAEAEDLPFLQELMEDRGGNAGLLLKLAELIVKIMGRNAVPILMHHVCYSRPHMLTLGPDGWRDILYEKAANLDFEQVVHILVDRLMIDGQYTPNVLLWTYLAKTQREEFIEHAISCICSHPDKAASFFCVDHLQSWPSRDKILTHFGQYVDTRASVPVEAKLLGAILGIPELFPEAERIFNESYSIGILGQRKPPPQDEIGRAFYDLRPHRPSVNTCGTVKCHNLRDTFRHS